MVVVTTVLPKLESYGVASENKQTLFALFSCMSDLCSFPCPSSLATWGLVAFISGCVFVMF